MTSTCRSIVPAAASHSRLPLYIACIRHLLLALQPMTSMAVSDTDVVSLLNWHRGLRWRYLQSIACKNTSDIHPHETEAGVLGPVLCCYAQPPTSILFFNTDMSKAHLDVRALPVDAPSDIRYSRIIIDAVLYGVKTALCTTSRTLREACPCWPVIYITMRIKATDAQDGSYLISTRARRAHRPCDSRIRGIRKLALLGQGGRS